MNLDEAQKEKMRQWIGEGLKLSEIQSRLEKEFGLRITYMEARFIVDDLKLVPKDPTPPPKPAVPAEPSALAKNAGDKPGVGPKKEAPPPQPSGVSITVDAIPRATSVVSGSVTFSDGKTATWMLDQMGRLGLEPQTPGYRPPPQDIEEFQMLLQEELAKQGI
jgi:hypothetical protein